MHTSVRITAPLQSINRAHTWPTECKMDSLNERKGFLEALFQRDGVWICSNIYILVRGRMGLLCSNEHKGETQTEWNSQKGKRVYFKVLFQCLGGITGAFLRSFERAPD